MKFRLGLLKVLTLFALVTRIGSVSTATRAEHQLATLVDDLQAPVGVAVRPITEQGSEEVFVADVGKGQVLRVRADRPDEVAPAITGFITSSDSNAPELLPGPHGLLFLEASRLVVTGSEGENRPFVRIYEVSDQKKPLSAEQHDEQARPSNADRADRNEPDVFQCVARTRANQQVTDYLILTSAGRQIGSSVWRLPVRGGTLGEPVMLGNGRATYVAVAVEPRGHIVVASGNESSDSRIDFINPIDGRVTMAVKVNLTGIRALAYSPSNGNLYAISQPASRSKSAGVFRIDAGAQQNPKSARAIAMRILDLEAPSAMAFGLENTLYLTTAESGKPGKLLKLSGEF